MLLPVRAIGRELLAHLLSNNNMFYVRRPLVSPYPDICKRTFVGINIQRVAESPIDADSLRMFQQLTVRLHLWD